MPTTARPAVDPGTLRQRLALLRRRLRLVATWRGVSLVLALLLTALVTAGLLDWSVHLPREAVGRALAKAAGCDFNRIVDARGLVPSSVCAATAAAVALPLILLFPALASTAVARLVNPFGLHDWPKKTQLELETPRLQV